MIRRSSLLVLSALVLVATAPRTAQGEYKQVPVVRHSVQAEVAAPPAAVWAQITQGKNLVTWCPVWKSPGNSKVALAKVGDALDFTDQWGNGGRSVVTFLSRGKELRVAHEPNDGAYLCQAKIILTPKGNATLVRYVESYTDESAPADLEATAKKMETEMAATLAALKKASERR